MAVSMAEAESVANGIARIWYNMGMRDRSLCLHSFSFNTILGASYRTSWFPGPSTSCQPRPRYRRTPRSAPGWRHRCCSTGAAGDGGGGPGKHPKLWDLGGERERGHDNY